MKILDATCGFKGMWYQKNLDEIIKMMPYPPLFGSNTKSKGHTQNFWILFIKYDLNKKLTML